MRRNEAPAHGESLWQQPLPAAKATAPGVDSTGVDLDVVEETRQELPLVENVAGGLAEWMFGWVATAARLAPPQVPFLVRNSATLRVRRVWIFPPVMR